MPEDRILDALGQIRRTGEDYYEDLAASLADGLHRGTIQPLLFLYRSGPARISAIAEDLGVDRTTVTRHLDDLERRGLVMRKLDESDRRGVVASLTAGTAERLDALRAQDRARIRRVCEGWTTDQLEMFAVLLGEFAERSGIK